MVICKKSVFKIYVLSCVVVLAVLFAMHAHQFEHFICNLFFFCLFFYHTITTIFTNTAEG